MPIKYPPISKPKEPVNWSAWIVEVARAGAGMGDCGKMCAGCAFKPGTEANLDEENIRQAVECIAYYGTFLCHMGDQATPPPCAGFKYAMRYLNDAGK